MDNVDLWLIDSLIESKTGSKGQPYISGKDKNLFLDLVQQSVPTMPMPRERSFDIFLVDQGMPDLFTLTGFSKPVVCYHLGYVGKFIKFRNYIMEDPTKPRIDYEGIANMFELVSTLYLQNGNSTFATCCLLQSIIQMPTQTIDTDVYENTNYDLHVSFFHHKQPIEESTFTLLYYGLTHELGHTYAEDCLRTGTKIHVLEITDEAITQAAIKSAKEYFKNLPASDAEDHFDLWYQSYMEAKKDKASIVHCDNLRSEILADNVGFNILFTSLSTLARYRNQKLNLKTIVSESIVGLFVVQLLETFKYLVKALPAEQQNPEYSYRFFPSIEELLGQEKLQTKNAPFYAELRAMQMIIDFQIAHLVRWEYLKPSFELLAHIHLFPDTKWQLVSGRLVANCSPSELRKQKTIAANNVEGYFHFYTKEIAKLQMRLADVVDFVGHMITNQVPEHRTKHTINETFVDYISGNFQTHLGLLNGEKGIKRKKEILTQLTEYKNLLQRHGTQASLQQIEGILQQLELSLKNHN